MRKLLEDRPHLDQLKDSRAREKELLDRLARLEEENRQFRRSGKDPAGLKERFQEASRGLTAVDFFRKATDLWVDGKYSDPGMALGYLDEALRLRPDFAEAYNNRGNAYKDLGEHSRAIQDYDQALRLKPDYAAYYNRGIAYLKVGNAQARGDLRAKYLMLGSRARGWSDVHKACQLGQCKAYEWARQEGYCR